MFTFSKYADVLANAAEFDVRSLMVFCVKFDLGIGLEFSYIECSANDSC